MLLLPSRTSLVVEVMGNLKGGDVPEQRHSIEGSKE
jgi:hypothetical protein